MISSFLVGLAAAAAIGATASSATSICLDPPTNALCFSYSLDVPNNLATLSATCIPPVGSNVTYWCGLGLTNASIPAMFPSQATVLQVNPANASIAFVEDRSAIAFATPLCFPTQISTLLNISSANGTLTAWWTRPITLPAALLDLGYFNMAGPMWLVGASSQDQGAATAPCASVMVEHTDNTPVATAVTF